MAYKKFKLDRRSEYQLHQATDLSVGLIITAENETEGPFAMGTEVLDVDDCDDIALYSWKSGRAEAEHWQVKEQRLHLETETLESILEHANEIIKDNPYAKIRLGLPALGNLALTSKKSMELRKLKELSELFAAPGVSPDRSTTKSLPEKLLREWFGFVSDVVGGREAAAALLSRFNIQELGDSSTVRRRTESVLAAYYHDANAARQAIERVLRMGNPLSRLRYEHLAPELESLSRVNVSSPWISFRYDNGSWWHRGSVARADVVSQAWGVDAKSLKLRLLAANTSRGSLPIALLRLALHSKQGATLECVDRDSWRDRAKQLTGGTLGNGDRNRIDTIFHETCSRPCPPTVPRPQDNNHPLSPKLGEDLEGQMNEAAWERVARQVALILEQNCGHASIFQDARDAWAKIENDMKAPEEPGLSLLHSSLRATVESESIQPAVRLGPQNADGLARMLILLIVLRMVFQDRFVITSQGRIAVAGISVIPLALRRCAAQGESPTSIMDRLGEIAYSGGIIVMSTAESPYEFLRLQDRHFGESQSPPYDAVSPEHDVIVCWGAIARRALSEGKRATVAWIAGLVNRATEEHQSALEATFDAIQEEEDDAP